MSDEELDQLFRESAEGYEPPFNPAAWADMNKRLDAHQAAHGGWAWLYPLLTLLLLGMLSLPVLLTQYQERPAASGDNQAKKNAITQQASTALPNQSRIPENPTQKLESSAAKVMSSGKMESFGNVKQAEPVRFSSDFQKTNQKRVSGQLMISSLNVYTRNRRPHQFKDTSPLRQEQDKPLNIHPLLPQLTSLARQEIVDAEEHSPETLAKGAGGQQNTVAADSSGRMAIGFWQLITKPSHDSLPDRKEPVDAQVNHFLKYVQVGVAFAPDLTTVKFKGADRVSPNAGLLVAVPLSKRFSLITGAVWSRKVYSAPSEEYAASPGSSTAPYGNDIDAVCQVLDIPVNLSYALLQKGNSKLALQAGLSSYVMLNEKYTYHYTAAYGYGNPAKTYTKKWEVDNENRHWFQVQNLSVSYARTFASGISLGVEPFVKIPLSGIGEGKVNLTSAGVFFSSSYTFHLKP